MTKLINNPHLTTKSLIELQEYSEDLWIQFDNRPYIEFFKELNKFIASYKHQITLRFYSYDGIWRDIEFLKYLPNLESLVIEDDYIEDILSISFLPRLKLLIIGNSTKPKSKAKLDLYNIPQAVEYLHLEGRFMNYEALKNMKCLKTLILQNIKQVVGLEYWPENIKYVKLFQMNDRYLKGQLSTGLEQLTIGKSREMRALLNFFPCEIESVRVYQYRDLLIDDVLYEKADELYIDNCSISNVAINSAKTKNKSIELYECKFQPSVKEKLLEFYKTVDIKHFNLPKGMSWE